MFGELKIPFYCRKDRQRHENETKRGIGMNDKEGINYRMSINMDLINGKRDYKREALINYNITRSQTA